VTLPCHSRTWTTRGCGAFHSPIDKEPKCCHRWYLVATNEDTVMEEWETVVNESLFILRLKVWSPFQSSNFFFFWKKLSIENYLFFVCI
jgi:hypothetical protein